MTDEQREKVRTLEFNRDRAVKALSKAGKEDGPEEAYARICKAIVDLRRASGEMGVLGVRRTRYKIGVS